MTNEKMEKIMLMLASFLVAILLVIIFTSSAKIASLRIDSMSECELMCERRDSETRINASGVCVCQK